MIEWFINNEYIDIRNLIDEATCENYNLFETLINCGIDSNNEKIDEIAFYSYSQENSLLKLYNILLNSEYEIKNNIIFYILCKDISYTMINPITNVFSMISNELMDSRDMLNNEKFKKLLNMDLIIITDDDLKINL